MPKFVKAAILGLVVGVLGCVLALADLGLTLEEEFGLHWLFIFRGPVPAPSDVVVITIDKTSAAALGQAGKIRDWNRALHAELIDKLAARGVSVIVFDVFFEKARPAEDDMLADAIARSQRVVLFQWINQDKLGSIVINRLLDPASELADAAQELAPFPVPKVTIRTHRFWAFCPSAGGAPTLPTVAYNCMRCASSATKRTLGF